jgi:hypothetical protein
MDSTCDHTPRPQYGCGHGTDTAQGDDRRERAGVRIVCVAHMHSVCRAQHGVPRREGYIKNTRAVGLSSLSLIACKVPAPACDAPRKSPTAAAQPSASGAPALKKLMWQGGCTVQCASQPRRRRAGWKRGGSGGRVEYCARARWRVRIHGAPRIVDGRAPPPAADPSCNPEGRQWAPPRL